MTEEHAERYIRIEKRGTRSVDDQVKISHGKWDHNIGPNQDGLREGDVEAELDLDLDYNVGTSLDHLVEIDVIEEVVPSGPDFYAISERLDDVINGRVDEVAAEDIEALIDHMQDDDPPEEEETTAVADGGGVTIRSLLSSEFDVLPDTMEHFLRRGDQVEKLNTAVEAITEHEETEKREDYDEITFRRGAHRYRLTEEQVARYEREGDD